jgi:hypothetical protein
MSQAAERALSVIGNEYLPPEDPLVQPLTSQDDRISSERIERSPVRKFGGPAITFDLIERDDELMLVGLFGDEPHRIGGLVNAWSDSE